MWLRLVGCVFVTVSCGALGILKARQWKEHRKMLEQLRKMIYLLRGEILYAHSPLGEALERVGRKSDGPIADWFCDVAKRLELYDGERFSQIWQEELDRRIRSSKAKTTEKSDGRSKTGDRKGSSGEFLLSPREIQELKEFGEHLGYLDVGMQERTIALYLEQLDMAIGFYREHEQERTRMCTSLGIMGGLFLAVILC